jgi:nucleoid-associated protein YgaU
VARTTSPTATAAPARSPRRFIHIVQPGESVWFIADLYGVRRRAIAEANGLTDPDHIEVGQRLIIPVFAP